MSYKKGERRSATLIGGLSGERKTEDKGAYRRKAGKKWYEAWGGLNTRE